MGSGLSADLPLVMGLNYMTVCVCLCVRGKGRRQKPCVLLCICIRVVFKWCFPMAITRLQSSKSPKYDTKAQRCCISVLGDHWYLTHNRFLNVMHNAPLKGLQTAPVSLRISCPFKLGANLQRARLPASDQTEKDRETACEMMNDELISEIQKATSNVANPAPTHCRALYISQPACLHISLLCCLSHSVLFLSLYVFDSLTACLLLFLSLSVLHGIGISVLCREALVPCNRISSLKPLHSPLPLIKA